MSYIIAVTDFSEVSENALHYACKLAQGAGASVTILHNFIIPVNFGEHPMPVMPIEEGKEIAEHRMASILSEYQTAYPGLGIGSHVGFGDIVDSLQEMVEKAKPLMIVLVNDEANDDLMWMGSDVVSIMRHVKVPVLGVPSSYGYNEIKKICYSCDFKNNDDATLAEDLKHLVDMTRAQLHILYVDKKSNESAEEQQLNMEDSILHTSLASISPVYHFVEKDSIDKGVQDFIESNAIDWLVIVPHKHSFLDNIFKKSHTKSLVKKIGIPLVALHEHHS